MLSANRGFTYRKKPRHRIICFFIFLVHFFSGKWWGPKDCQPVIAIHGWQDNAGSFDKLAPLITKRNYSILAIDLPGHGLSSKYHKGQFYYIFWDGIHLLRRIVKHFNWEKITIIGHSLGGAIAFLYAAAFPNDIVKYVSIDIASPAVRDPAKISKVLGDAVDKFLKYESFKEEDAQPMSYEDALDILYDAHKTSLTKESCKILMVGSGHFLFEMVILFFNSIIILEKRNEISKWRLYLCKGSSSKSISFRNG